MSQNDSQVGQQSRRRPTLAAAITRDASAQTYWTIRCLVDRACVEDAYRAYAYFRWVDDILDAQAPASAGPGDGSRVRRLQFLDRQKWLLDRCLKGHAPRDVVPHERMLVELVRHDVRASGLETYLLEMMRVMEFDVRRRGQVVSAADLDGYTRSLAMAVTEALQHFIGNGSRTPHDETRYSAVTGAHILHMLRDTFTDLRAGYYNIPQEVLDAHAIGPHELDSDGYRAWVRHRVELARGCLDAGRTYFARVESLRHRLAGLAYIARFDWLIPALESTDYRLCPAYPNATGAAIGLRTWRTVVAMTGIHPRGAQAWARAGGQRPP